MTLLHFSDYHSHALPFYTEAGVRGGIARAIGFLQREKRAGALVFSGGDMINRGAPAWSDRYGCAEWPWLNGLVDAMALGNHEPDYGRTAFERCRDRLRYPVLSANTPGFDSYRVIVRNGLRVGVFAVAGADFEKLGVRANLAASPGEEAPPFGDPVSAAREAVRTLRGKERADLVVMIGHQHAEADERLARDVPGIDLIFGTHSHLTRALARIEGTETWFISPGQYLEWISRVEVTVEGGRIRRVSGGLVAVDAKLPENRRVARRVRRMQRDLERDPRFRELFVPLATLPRPMTTAEVAMAALEAMRAATRADVALSTVSSFRAALPAGPVTPELLRAALPYDNEVVVCEMTPLQLAKILAESEARKGTDSTAFVSGAAPPAGAVRVATTDYLANVSYRGVFDCGASKTGLRVRAELTRALTR